MATVSLAPRATSPYGVTIANKFGYVNVTNRQNLANFPKVFAANGTIYFDVRGWERTQIIYSYLVRAFGNGTLDLRFITSGIMPSVRGGQLATSQVFTSSNIQVVDYTSTAVSDPLSIVFQTSASQQVFNAAVYASFFFGIIITSIGVLYAVTLFSNVKRGFDTISGSRTRAPAVSTTQVTIVGVMVIVGFGIMIIIAVFFGNVLKGIGS